MDQVTTTKTGSYTRKLALNTASLASLYALPIASQAGVVYVDGSPLTLSIDDARVFDYQPIDWDVDGNSVADFRLEAFRTINYTGGSSTTDGSYYPGLSFPEGRLELNDATGGRGMVQNATDSPGGITALNAGDTVGPTLAAGKQWSPPATRVLMTSFSYDGFPGNGLFDGTSFVGLRFDSNGQTLYGWAEILLDTNLLEMSVLRWAYEDSGNRIEVGAVPLPSAAVLMLSGLALGAGGITRGRKLRQAQKEQPPA
ncbi:MAG TPA: hypothetical protein ENJ80_02260 [Gammaproteobacteria bacterium]|nr:hypothetical protein [Gammaproteobacteria bacterium]